MTNRHTRAAGPPQEPGEPEDVPLEFAAFCELHRPRYLSYARVWLTGHGEATTAVQEAFAEIAVQWRELLTTPNPTALAWQILRATVAEHTRQVPVTPDRHPADDDLAILHYVVGLAAPEIADVIGTDTASVAGRLRRTMLREATGW
ncbi:hypothetical protein [Kitasatospora sp. SUK 42]|uniref:hypothetical protein n=1 Tax=Kitasatospora sp. SUK 42 TaxID=1588882 RepID=UPI0018C9C180|nr:hypothetical protein [Kitasatospora sp. SUK 42]MBV2154164.1 hypothetical protein [Kitasatospora sp. SUK 42]